MTCWACPIPERKPYPPEIPPPVPGPDIHETRVPDDGDAGTKRGGAGGTDDTGAQRERAAAPRSTP